MTANEFLEQLDSRIAKYDLLSHPFYKAWSAGELTRDDLREYARDYYCHVEAFPTYLAELAMRLDDGDVRRTVLANMQDELGHDTAAPAPAHSQLWLDFAEGMGARRDLRGDAPAPEVKELTAHFHRVASEGTPEEALAAFYAYESQVPRVATEKERGLRAMYGADDKTCAYFTLHATADVYHSRAWRKQLENQIETNPEVATPVLDAAEKSARALWNALDGIEARRMKKAA